MRKETIFITKMKEYDSYGNVKYKKKWNDLYQRYEIYDTYGNMVGYYKWNELYRRWEFISK